MIRLGVLFLVMALVAALLGFGWVADLSFAPARAACFFFLALAAVSFVAEALERRSVQDAS
jgi:uncharacterized membrane protein YtjA (UPF0391 family)